MMGQPNPALRDAIAAAERLPLKLQRQLAERLLAQTTREDKSLTVRLLRLSREQQARLAELMDKSNEGTLRRAERAELKRLGSEVNEMMLENSVALARALRSELFDVKGRPVKSRLRRAVSQSYDDRHSRQENTHS